MMNVIYHCPNTVARYQIIEQLMEFSDKQIRKLTVTRTRDGFDVQCDEVTDDVHSRITTGVANISWEVISESA
jgi:hypothetical protein